MTIQRKPIIVVLGMMTIMPVGGVIWQTLHYLIGFARLGFDVYYVEDHGMPPGMFSNAADPDGSACAAEFVAHILARFDLGDQWSYRAWHGNAGYHGISQNKLERVLSRATAVINLHGGTIPRDEHRRAGPLIYVETDPVGPEVELHNSVKATEDFLDQHAAYFTFGENLGAADCKVPMPPPKYTFHKTRQPVVCDFWNSHGFAARDVFTTIANWRQPEREMTLDGEVYSWSKHWEFMKFIDLPQQTNDLFELALSSYEDSDRDMLAARGWRVTHALDFSGDIDRYREYICTSRGEWTVAKDQNVRLRSGWFSDRATTYLAAGRPVITQETGFSNVLPTGCGLFAFSTMEEIIAAVDLVRRDYDAHSRAAKNLAIEYFDAEKVLADLLSKAGIKLPHQRQIV